MPESTAGTTAPDAESRPLDFTTTVKTARPVVDSDAHLPGEDVETAVLRWSRHPRCVALARLELRKSLAGWGLSELEDSAVLIVSELLSNAGLHAGVSRGQGIETRYVRSSGGLRIEVHDGSPVRPQPRTPDPESCDGRGLLLVDALADEWGVADRDGPGKVVWAELALPVGQSGEGGCW
ncbi:ATP-binding protein [Streptomyces sp. NBC_00872]|uniref:ATP-binding protein n=1 Tax=Streptomyces sp. NBC_00872 TaxID=2903686 RepID=UPI0038683A79